jgi:hypothetical protein
MKCWRKITINLNTHANSPDWERGKKNLEAHQEEKANWKVIGKSGTQFLAKKIYLHNAEAREVTFNLHKVLVCQHPKGIRKNWQKYGIGRNWK